MSTQDFFTSRRNYNDGTIRIGELGRLWYDSETNTIRVGDGSTPGGKLVSAATFSGDSSVGHLLYFQSTPSDIPFYETLTTLPVVNILDDESISVSAADGELPIDQYITAANEFTAPSIPPGEWKFRYWSYVDKIAQTTQLRFKVSIRHLDTSETVLFSVDTADINNTTSAELEIIWVTTEPHVLLTTDRLVIRVYAITTSNSHVVIHWVHDDGNASHVHTPIPLSGGGVATSGYSGYSGRDGAAVGSGYSGMSGYSGAAFVGSSGYSGSIGYSGYSGVIGYSGYSGVVGYSGYSGIDAVAATTTPYRFSDDITDSDPGVGKLKINSASLGGATLLWVDYINDTGQDLTNYLTVVNPGDKLYLQVTGDSSKYAFYTVTSRVNKTGYYEFGLTLISTTGTISNNSKVSFSYSNVGQTGTSGYSGVDGGPSNWTTITGNTAAVSKSQYIANTAGGSFWLILPPTPVLGDVIVVNDGSDLVVNPLYVDSNGKAIDGVTDNLVIDVKHILVQFLYDGTQWQVAATAGPRGLSGYSGYSGIPAAENTWVPNVSSTVGSISSATASGRYAKIGNTYFIYLDVNVTSNGTGSGLVNATLPAIASAPGVVTGIQGTTGNALVGNISMNSNIMVISNYDNSYPASDNSLLKMSGFFI